MTTVWVLEDDRSVQGLLRFMLEQEGLEVEAFAEAAPMLEALRERAPAALILDLGLPDLDGVEVCRQIRQGAHADLPIMVVTASRELTDRYRTLATGADDFLTKPIDNLELVLRVRNLLRRTAGHQAGEDHWLRVGELELDLRNHEIRVGSRLEALTPSEFAVLKYLMERPGQPIDVETLLVEALGYPRRLGNPDILRTHVRNLRRKLEDDPEAPRRLLNRPRLGYLVPEGVAHAGERAGGGG